MIALAQMDVVPNRPEQNTRTMIGLAEAAHAQGYDSIAYPEMSVSGYCIGDGWERRRFLDTCQRMDGVLAETSRRLSMNMIYGNVKTEEDRGRDGRPRRLNVARVVANGNPVSNGVFDGYTVKALFPNYRMFDDERFFTPLGTIAAERGMRVEDCLRPFELTVGGIRRRIGVTICEDAWDGDYTLKPIKTLNDNGAEEQLNIATSLFGRGKQGRREKLFSKHSQRTPISYVNASGVQDNGKNIFVMDGGSGRYEGGQRVSALERFRAGVLGGDMIGTAVNNNSPTHEVFEAIIMGIREFVARIGVPKVVIGLSGGIDSAVVAALMVIALGADRVVAVNMPSKHNSKETQEIARKQAQKLGIDYRVIPIQESVDWTKHQIETVMGVSAVGIVGENIQARDRGARILAGVAAAVGGAFTNNGNKTEIATGFATLYGDVGGFMCPIGDLYKSEVYALARHINTLYPEMIPEEAISIRPSAELGENHCIAAGKGDPFDYPYHDRLLYELVEMRREPEDIIEEVILGTLDQTLATGRPVIGGVFLDVQTFVADLERIWRLLHGGIFKRVQAPPILTVSRRSFGFDLRESQTGYEWSEEYQNLKNQLLMFRGVSRRAA